ncbi:protein WVD2-like 7 isoform X2 [Macadamia integrifolia]|uniref:protein WVD2-like 7 isoform X2 n=1 Tax=Macadamia integrifolia TaxID=60698 RepID=UPI001C4EDA36|nr:protein WVD2-like 7 isoform X2 [Macadamia integrifolia]
MVLAFSPDFDAPGNPMHALAGSVSFGRFLSESLAWEKWSSFSHNRYLEDVEKYSRPGSVAQKKAYFEAHYKKVAAKKAEAAAGSTPQPETQDGVHSNPALDSQMEKCDDHVAVDEPRQATVPNMEEGFIIDSSRRNSIVEMDRMESSKVEVVDPVIEDQVLEKNSLVVESSQLADVGNRNMLTEVEPSGTIQMNQTHSEVAASPESLTSTTNAKLMASSLKPSAYSRERMLSSSPAKSTTTIPSRKENIATPNNKSARDPVQKKCPTPKSLHMPINFASNQENLASATKTNPALSSSKPSAYRRASELQSPTAKLTTPLHSRKGNNPTPNSKKSVRDPGNKKCPTPKSLHTSINFAANQETVASATKTKSFVSSSKPSVYGRALKLPSSPDKSSTVHSRKENATPNSKKFASDLVNKKCSTPKSLHMSINAPSGAGETNKTSSAQKKIADSRGSGSVSTSKHCPTPLRTPTMASVNGLPKNPSVTPQSEQKSTRTELGFTSSGCSKVGAKWHSLSTDHSKSLSAGGGITRSPTVSSPFSFRTDERAAKRKEKLENKFNAERALNVQLQKKPKEKAENELNKLHQSFSFKAKPMPDFYRATGSGKNQIKKIPQTQLRSPKLGQKPISNAVQDSSSLPPRRPEAKNYNSMGVMEKNNRIPTHSITELPNKDTHENSPPNIQQ